MKHFVIACILIGFVQLVSTDGSYKVCSNSDSGAILIGIIALSFSITSQLCILLCIFVGLICICAKKCCRQPAQSAPGMAFVSYVPYYQCYMPLMHGHPITHSKAAVHGQPMMNTQPAVHYQPVRLDQRQQTFSNRDVPQQSSSFFVPEAPSAAS